MTKSNFPFIAVILCLPLFFLVMLTTRQDSVYSLPLLTLLIVSEFGFIVTAAGAYLAIRTQQELGYTARMLVAGLVCICLAVVFFWKGIQLWPQPL
jgi:hypothetical protein